MALRLSTALLASSLVLSLVSAPGIAAAQAQIGGGSPKPAWKWTLEERLAKRFDPEQVKARANERRAEQRAAARRLPPDPDGLFAEDAPSAMSGQVNETIEGRKTPELFLPMELFDHLLSMGFPPGGGGELETRRIIEQRAAALGFGQDLWQRLSRATAGYLAFQRERERFARANSHRSREQESNLDDDGLRWCRARAAAFSAAKAEFGEEKLFRLLYEGVTPSFSRTYVVDDPTEHLQFLRFVERGCH